MKLKYNDLGNNFKFDINKNISKLFIFRGEPISLSKKFAKK